MPQRPTAGKGGIGGSQAIGTGNVTTGNLEAKAWSAITKVGIAAPDGIYHPMVKAW